MAFAYNTSVHACTGYTPYYLTHGHKAQVPVNVLFPNQTGSDLPVPHADFTSDLVGHLNVAFANARQNVAVANCNENC